MNVKNAMLAVAFAGAVFTTSASAMPIFSVPSDTTATNVGDDNAGDIAGRVIRGLGGPGSDRYNDYDRRRYGGRDYYGRRDRDRDFYRGHDRDREYDHSRD